MIKNRLAYLSEVRAIVVLNLHRVAPDDKSAYRPLSPHLFEELLDFCQKNFRITTLSKIDRNYKGSQVVISFDDGYLDFYEYVVPVVAKRRICVNQNIVPLCAESGLPPLNVLAQDFIGKAPTDLLKGIDIPGFGKKVSAFEAQNISRFIKFLSAQERSNVSDYIKDQFFKWEEFEPTKMMGLDHMMEIKDLHEIGAHSFAHDSLGVESDDFAEDDAGQCRKWFKENLRLDPDIYAFPNGSFKESQIERVKKHGFARLLFSGESLNGLDVLSSGRFRRFTFDANNLCEVKFRATGKFVKVKE
jgi:peptidoglycan/xylan/chitin deacetylase (PgdA/CDA1 family)